MEEKFYCKKCKRGRDVSEEKVDEYGHPFKILSCGHETPREVKVSDNGRVNDGIRITKAVEEKYVVEKKLEGAEYFLNNLKNLEKKSGNLASADLFLILVNLDGFFFETVAAKDLFLQQINRDFKGGLSTNRVKEDKLINSKTLDEKARKAVKQIRNAVMNEMHWLWRLNNYRNATAHRSVLKITTKTTTHIAIGADLERPNQPRFSISNLENQQSPFLKNNTDIYPAIYLAEDPDNSSKGYHKQSVISYCEEVLQKMREFLDNLKSQL